MLVDSRWSFIEDDSNGNEYIKFVTTASAVNEISIN
jgi:hypothetical protein